MARMYVGPGIRFGYEKRVLMDELRDGDAGFVDRIGRLFQRPVSPDEAGHFVRVWGDGWMSRVERLVSTDARVSAALEYLDHRPVLKVDRRRLSGLVN